MSRPLRLTARELEILRELQKGSTNHVIAETLEISQATVKVHLTNIFNKIGCHNRVQACVWALTNLKSYGEVQ